MGKAGDIIGREIVEAAEAEIAKRYSAEPRLHWRRHNDVAACIDWRDLVATGCGRLVEVARASKDPEQTDCRECAEVYFMTNPPPWVHSGV